MVKITSAKAAPAAETAALQQAMQRTCLFQHTTPATLAKPLSLGEMSMRRHGYVAVVTGGSSERRLGVSLHGAARCARAF